MHGHQRLDATAGAHVHPLIRAPLAPFGDESLQSLWRKIESCRIYVAKKRPRAHARDRAGGCEKRVGTRDDLVTRADLKGHERDQQRIGAGGDADAVFAVRVLCDLRFELTHLGAQDEVLARADFLDCGLYRALERAVLHF